MTKEARQNKFSQPGWLSVREAAERYRVSRSTIYRWVTAGKVCSEQPGGKGGTLLIRFEKTRR